MFTIGIVLVHNKTNNVNRAQIDAVRNNLEEFVVYDDEGNPAYFWRIKRLARSHAVKVFQVIPSGVPVPNNMAGFDAYTIYYDSAKPLARYFNVLLKRTVDWGCDLLLYIDDRNSFTASEVDFRLGRFVNNIVLLEPTWAKFVLKRVLLEVGQLREDTTIFEALADLRQRIVDRGMAYE